MRKADYKVSAKPVRINGFCSICKKETNIERPMEQGYTNSFYGEEVDAEVIIVEDTKQLGEGTAALPPPPNPWASKNRKQTDDSDNDGQ